MEYYLSLDHSDEYFLADSYSFYFKTMISIFTLLASK